MTAFHVLLFITVVVNMGAGVIIPLMPILLKDFGFSNESLSFAFFALVGARFLAQNVGGRFISRLGAYPVLLAALVLYIGTMLVYPAIETKALFVLFRFAEGVFEGAALVCLNDLVVGLTSREKRGKQMGLFGAAFGLGFILGPLVGGLLYEWQGREAIFLGTAVVAATGVLALVVRGRDLSGVRGKGADRKGLLPTFKRAHLAYLPFYSPYILRRVLFFAFQMILPLYLHERFLVSPERVGIYFSISAILSTTLMPLGGRVADRLNPPRLLSACLLVMAVCIASFGGTDRADLFLAVYVVETIAFSVMLPTAMKLFGDMVADLEDRAVILGSFGGIMELTSLVVPFVVLPLYGVHVALPWLFLSGLTLAASVPFVLTAARPLSHREAS